MQEFWDLIVSSPGGFSMGAILSIVAVSLIRGWLVPRRVLLDLVQEKDLQIDLLSRERDDWKEAFNAKSEVATELLSQNGELIEGARTTRALLEALRAKTVPESMKGGESA